MQNSLKETVKEKGNPYRSERVKITDVVRESPTIKTLELRPQEPFSFETGQFVQLSVPGVGEAPFTPSSSPEEEESLEVTVMEAGEVTGKLHEMSPGESLGLRGPYGVGYPLSNFEDEKVLVVGGGVGLAPLRSLVYVLLSRSESFGETFLKYGARTPDDLIYKDQLEKWTDGSEMKVELTVDEADEEWEGNVGVVTTLLEDLKVSSEEGIAVVCGPPVMMKFTVGALEENFQPSDIYLSLEKHMSCGIGLCGHCQLGKYYVCKDGPVFSYDQVKDIPTLWE